jgi:hypothetical protein
MRRQLALAGVTVLAGLAGSTESAADYSTLYEQGVAKSLATFRAYPPRRIVGMTGQ